MPVKKKNTNDLLGDLNKKLDVIARLLALSLPESINQDEKIKILDDVGVLPKEIAIILGTTSNVVSVTLNRIRKKGQNKPT